MQRIWEVPMTLSRLSLAVGAVLVVALVALAGPALAHEGWIVRTWGKAGTYEAHHHIDVCDEAVDSSVVSARFHLWHSHYAGPRGPGRWGRLVRS
jgi:hypothetical protein